MSKASNRILTPVVVGQRFGRLVVTAIQLNPTFGGLGKRRFTCACDCGRTLTNLGSNLVSGNTKSCGCLKRLRAAETGRKHSTTHGNAGKASEAGVSPEYLSWKSMKARCLNAAHTAYAEYGGRGIKIADRWLNDFPAFREDMGPRPSRNHTLERIDTDGDYHPGNCKWSTRKEQARNRRNTQRHSTGELVAVICEGAVVSPPTVRARLRAGWSIEAARLTPARAGPHPKRAPYKYRRDGTVVP